MVLAALTTLGLGAVLGPEAPLIALGGGLGVLRGPAGQAGRAGRTTAVVAAAGSFAAISTLLGSPLLGAFLLMEASGLSGAMLELVLVPGLLAAGIGALVFIGLDSDRARHVLAGHPGPAAHRAARPSPSSAGRWSIGLAAAILGTGIRWLGLALRDRTERWTMLATPLVGLAVAGLAIAYAAGTGKGSSEVLFSGQNALGPLIDHASGYTVGALLLLLVCKGLAYGGSLSSFRGGPIFPAMFLGAAGGLALSHLPGLPLVAGAAMGIGAMTRGDAPAAADLRAAGDAAAVLGRPPGHAAGDRRGRGRLRGVGPAGPGPGQGGGTSEGTGPGPPGRGRPLSTLLAELC